MKLIGRTLAILAAALIVVGATFALGNSGMLGGFGGPGGGEFRERQTAGATTGTAAQGTRPQRGEGGGFREGGREGGPGGFFAIAELGKSVGVIGVIVALVAFGRGVIQRRWPKKGARLTESRL